MVGYHHFLSLQPHIYATEFMSSSLHTVKVAQFCQLKDVFAEAFECVVGELTMFVAINGDVGGQGEKIRLGICPSGIICFAHCWMGRGGKDKCVGIRVIDACPFSKQN